jgi:integrase
MPVTKRPDTGHYQVTVCYGGRTHRKTSRHWSFAEAKDYERRYVAKLKDVEAGVEPERVISDALEKWTTEHVPRLRSARKTLNHSKALVPYILGRPLGDIAKVWAEIKAAEQLKAPATTNHKGRILRQIGRAAWREWGWLDRPPAITLLPETHRETFLSLDQVKALADAMGSAQGRGYVLLAAYTGIRRGHLLRLTAFDIKGDCIRLDRSSKTRTLQLIPLHPKVKAIAAKLPLGIGGRQLQEEWNAARMATGIDCRWHDLRHTCASWLVQAGVPIYTVALLLGHSSTAVTQRYAHLAPKDLAEAVAKLA